MKHMEVYLDIFGFSFDPDQAAQIIGQQADKMQKIGEVSEGKRRAAKENSLSFYSKADEENELDLHIKDIFQRLDLMKVQKLANKDASFTLRAVVRIPEGQSSPSSALVIERSTMKELAQLNCELDLDVYAM